MMTFLLFAPASTRWLGWRKDRKSRRDRLGRLCDIYCQSYFVLLRFISDRHPVEKLTFFKFVDQKPLVKRRWSYNGWYKHFDILPDTKSQIFHCQTLFLSHWSIGRPTSSLHERGRDSCFMRWCSKIVLCCRSGKNFSFLRQFRAPLARKFINIFNFLRNFMDATFCRRNGLKWKIVKAQVCTAMLAGFPRHLSPGGGGVLPRILDRGLLRRFVNPNPI